MYWIFSSNFAYLIQKISGKQYWQGLLYVIVTVLDLLITLLFFYQKAETKIFLGDLDSKAGCEGGRSNYKKRSLSATPTNYLKSLKIAWYLFSEMSSIEMEMLNR